jgi:hypothetical protein
MIVTWSKDFFLVKSDPNLPYFEKTIQITKFLQ